MPPPFLHSKKVTGFQKDHILDGLIIDGFDIIESLLDNWFIHQLLHLILVLGLYGLCLNWKVGKQKCDKEY